MLKDRNGTYVRYGLGPGTSDLIGLTSKGRFLSVEVKSESGRATIQQVNWIDAVNAMGGIGFFARSVEEFETNLRIALEPGI
jgi:hypothetical protein